MSFTTSFHTDIIFHRFSSGLILGISVSGIPALLINPSTSSMLTQWAHMFNAGKALMPKIAGIAAITHFSTAYLQYKTRSPWIVSVASGILSLSIVPYTVLYMVPTTIDPLLRMLSEIRVQGGQEKVVEGAARRLVDTWGTQNFFRGLLPLAGSILALWTALVY